MAVVLAGRQHRCWRLAWYRLQNKPAAQRQTHTGSCWQCNRHARVPASPACPVTLTQGSPALPTWRRWDLPPRAATGGASITLAGDALHPMTPNLGQGGCTALEDGLVLARCLQQEGAPAAAAALQDGGSGGSGGQEAQQRAAEAVRAALRRYEAERAKRCLPLTVRSHLMGAALQVGGWARAACALGC